MLQHLQLQMKAELQEGMHTQHLLSLKPDISQPLENYINPNKISRPRTQGNEEKQIQIIGFVDIPHHLLVDGAYQYKPTLLR